MVSHPPSAMIASLFTNHTTLADVLFLIAAVLAVINALATWGRTQIPSGVSAACTALAIALVALGLMFL